jgi:hypothetical protein
MLKKKLYFFFFSLIFICITVSYSSCKKKESCSETRFNYLTSSDTLAIYYSGKETLEYLITDSLGVAVDSIRFIGQGKTKLFTHGDVEFTECEAGIAYDNENLRYTYVNEKDSKFHLLLNIEKEKNHSIFTIQAVYNIDIYGRVFFQKLFFAPSTLYRDSLLINGITYKNGIQLTIPGKELKPGEPGSSAYFSHFDGLIYIEETRNRFWYLKQ